MNARIVLAQGLIDGVNRVFQTGVPYVPGSTAYILNGRIHSLRLARGPENDYGYLETNPATGEITVDVPPDIDDVVQIFFWDWLVAPPPPITSLTGTIPTGAAGSSTGGGRQTLTGVIREPVPARLAGVVQSSRLSGVVRDPAAGRLAGVVRSQRIVGTIKERC